MSRCDPTPLLYGDALDAALIAAVAAGERWKIVAWRLGRSKSAVRRRLAALRRQGRVGYRNKAWSPEEDLALAQALAGGARAKTLAARFGRSPDAVSMRAVKLRAAIARAKEEAAAPMRRIGARSDEGRPPAAVDRDQLKLDLAA